MSNYAEDSGRQRVVLDPAVASILTPRPPEPQQPAQQAGRVVASTPHERDRKERQMSITFPDPEWCDAVRELAERWDVRPGDVMVYAASRFFADLKAGKVEGPRVRAGYQDRASDVFDLPWEPE